MKRLVLILCLLGHWLTGRAQVTEGYEFHPTCLNPETLINGVYLANHGSEVCYHNETPFSSSQNAYVHLLSSERISLKNDFRITDLNTGGRMHARIEAVPMSVRIITPDPNLGPIVRNEKFEVGIRPPSDVLDRIQTFIDYTMDKDYPHASYSGNNPYEHLGWEAENGLNPFMSWDIRVYGTYELIDEANNAVETKTVDGFYFEDWHRVDTNNDLADDDWERVDTELPFRIRAALGKQGRWRCRFFLEVEGQLLVQTQPYFVDVINDGGEGFVEVASNNMYLKKDGESFFPVGRNNSQPNCNPNVDGAACSVWQYSTPVTEPGGEYRYDPWHITAYAFQKFEDDIQGQYDEGCRYFRYITNSSTDDLEHELLGNYYKRLRLGNELDRIFDKVESLDGMHMHWVMNIGRNLYETGPYSGYYYDWRDGVFPCEALTENLPVHAYYRDAVANPYHKFLPWVDDPMDFFTDLLCQAYYKEKLRYMVSRWGYCTRVAQMDLMSEIEGVGQEKLVYKKDLGVDPETGETLFECDDVNNKYHPYTGEAKKIEDPMGFHSTPPEAIDDPVNQTEPQGFKAGQWQAEMARYIKEDLQHTDHLIGINYGSFRYPRASCPEDAVSENQQGDGAFTSPHVDVLTFNYYDYGDPEPDRLHLLSEITEELRINISALGVNKPVLVTEIGTSLGDDPCENDVEWIREILVSSFTGIAGSGMPWAHQWEYRPDLSQWQEWMSEFFGTVDLASQTWTPKRKTTEDNKAEILYLENANGEIVGIAHNLTYNFYSMRDNSEFPDSKCANFDPDDPLHNDGWVEWKNFYPVVVNDVQDELCLPGCGNCHYLEQFDIEGSPTSPTVSAEVTSFHFNLDVDNPFQVFKVTTSSGRMASPALDGNEIEESLESEQEDHTFEVWPNPTTEMINVEIMPFRSMVEIFVVDLSGRVVLEEELTSSYTAIDVSGLGDGAYNLVMNSEFGVEYRRFEKLR